MTASRISRIPLAVAALVSLIVLTAHRPTDGPADHALPVATPDAVASTLDSSQRYGLAIGDTILVSVWSCLGLSYTSSRITHVDIREDGAWVIAGRVGSAFGDDPMAGVPVALVRCRIDTARLDAPSNTPDAQLFGMPVQTGPAYPLPVRRDPMILPVRHIAPLTTTVTRPDGTFELTGFVSAGTCLMVGGTTEYIRVYDVGRLVWE